MQAINFGRVMTAMATPFDSKGDINLKESIRLAHYLVETGTDTLVLAGTTGESPTLTHAEEAALFRAIVTDLKGKAKIIAGAGSNSTKTAIDASKRAHEIGVDGLLQVVPYYNRPSQEGLYQHFKAIAEATPLPILLYNIPGRTGRNMEVDTIRRLAQIPTIIGNKESAGSVEQVRQQRLATPKDFLIYSGDDGLTLDFIKAGAYGVVSVAAHCVGAHIQTMINMMLSGDESGAYALQKQLEPLYEALFMTTNPVPVKAALEMMGFEMGNVRLPLVPLTVEEKTQLYTVLEKYNLALLRNA